MSDRPPSVVPRPSILVHVLLLAIAVMVVGLAAVLDVHRGSQVVIPIVQWPLPPTCMFQNILGLDCPGCGLTRCFISLAHGQWSMAWKYHPVGIVFFLIVLAQIPYRSWQIWRIKTLRGEARVGGAGWAVLVFLVLIIGQWVIRAILGRL